MALSVHVPTVFVGTAKSVLVAKYGRMERGVLRHATNVFVRDDATAVQLRRHNVAAVAPGNVIVDLFAVDDDSRADATVAGFDPAIAIFPGSRESAYADGAFLAQVLRESVKERPHIGAVLSVAPQLEVERFESIVRDAGFDVRRTGDDGIVFEGSVDGRVALRAWRGSIGVLLRRVKLVIGQAGTANEAAAAAGVPVVAFELATDRKTAWYRMRQHGLLGEALTVLPADVNLAASGVLDLLDNDSRRARMGAVGRARMGPAGGAAAIARAIAGTSA
jgi:uncharacterized protein (TIGR03492 family)